jgi:hypothetical protein
VEADFKGGTLTSDAGVLLLGEVESQRHILSRLAGCFHDYRDPRLIEHSLQSLLTQRIFGMALGHEDLNDHDLLRRDPVLATVAGKLDPTGQDRCKARDKGCPLAGKSTLNRLELFGPYTEGEDRYKRITPRYEEMDDLLGRVCLEAHRVRPPAVEIDLDATDSETYGNQEGKFFHGYYKKYCYLPLIITCNSYILCARLRRANIDGAFDCLTELKRVVAQIRAQWPDMPIVVRGDSGFCREELMAWCEANGVDYVLGLAQNARLTAALASAMAEAKAEFACTGEACRRFADFRYQTEKTWSRARRVIGKAEMLAKGENPRFIVTSLEDDWINPQGLYEKGYCARGEMENRIKEVQSDMFGDRLSCGPMVSNQLRLYWSVFAYTMILELKRLALQGTELATAYAGTIRLKLFRISAQVKVSVRRVAVHLATSWPGRNLFLHAYDRLMAGREPGGNRLAPEVRRT